MLKTKRQHEYGINVMFLFYVYKIWEGNILNCMVFNTKQDHNGNKKQFRA